MALDTKEKRQAVFSVGKVWNRNTFPVATPDEQWRMSVGNVYGGNALNDATPTFNPVWARNTNTLIGGM